MSPPESIEGRVLLARQTDDFPFVLASGCDSGGILSPSSSSATPRSTYEIIRRTKHDAKR